MNALYRSLGLALVGLAVLLGSARSVLAQQGGVMAKEFSQGEIALLPNWCIDTQAGPFGGPEGGTGLNRSPRAAMWVSKMGTDFWHMHHYCWGLRDMLRLQRAGLTDRERQFLRTRAIAEFNYVLSNCRPTMPLMPEVLLKKGEVHAAAGELVAAKESFEAARKLRPDYWPAYSRWIDELVKLRQFDQALELAREGLKQAPDSVVLKERLQSLQKRGRGAEAG